MWWISRSPFPVQNLTVSHTHFGFKPFRLTFSLSCFLSDNCFNLLREFSVQVRLHFSSSKQAIYWSLPPHAVLPPLLPCICFSVHPLFLLHPSLNLDLSSFYLHFVKAHFMFSHCHKPFKVSGPCWLSPLPCSCFSRFVPYNLILKFSLMSNFGFFHQTVSSWKASTVFHTTLSQFQFPWLSRKDRLNDEYCPDVRACILFFLFSLTWGLYS